MMIYITNTERQGKTSTFKLLNLSVLRQKMQNNTVELSHLKVKQGQLSKIRSPKPSV